MSDSVVLIYCDALCDYQSMDIDDWEYAIDVIANATIEKSVFGSVKDTSRLCAHALEYGSCTEEMSKLFNSLNYMNITALPKEQATDLRDRMMNGHGYNVHSIGPGVICLTVDE